MARAWAPLQRYSLGVLHAALCLPSLHTEVPVRHQPHGALQALLALLLHLTAFPHLFMMEDTDVGGSMVFPSEGPCLREASVMWFSLVSTCKGCVVGDRI